MILSYWDFLLLPLYLLPIFFFASYVKIKKEREIPAYKYLVKGLTVKIAGALALGFVYVFYYKGGDTINYFQSSVALTNLLFEKPALAWEIISGQVGDQGHLYFDASTGYPIYRITDKHAFFVVKLLVPFVILGLKCYLPMAALVGTVAYIGLWRLYLVYVQEFPLLMKELAIALLFIPSVVFWGSGILKDSFTLCSVCWYVSSFYFLFVRKKKAMSFHIVSILLSSTLLIAIKPYIFFALLPGSMIWLSMQQLDKVGSKILRFIFGPAMLLAGSTIGFLALQEMSSNLGTYALENVMDRAAIVQHDLKQDYYGGKTFDIGDFEPTVAGMASKAHLAIFAALFRPSLLDVRNVVMLLSSLENTYLLLLTMFLLIRLKFFGFFSIIWKNPLVLFSALFSLFFAFSVGIAISNFGSLVRLKIPAIPFFVATLFIVRFFYEQKRITPRS